LDFDSPSNAEADCICAIISAASRISRESGKTNEALAKNDEAVK
jgi:hypothetical protein